MTRQNKSFAAIKKCFFIIIFEFFLLNFVSGEIIQFSSYKFSLDVPEGFTLEDASEDGMSFLFTHPNIPISFAIKIYDPLLSQKFENSTEVLNFTLNKLNSEFYCDKVLWNNSECAISSFSMVLDQNYEGWAAAAPLSVPDCYTAIICYAPESQINGCNQFIMSLLNSLCVDENFYCCPGIVLSYAFPKEGNKKVNLNIGGKSINTTLDNSDIEAANFLVELEYSVLNLYGQHPKWKEAWERYYRMIYRDSFGRLEPCISDVMDVLIPAAKKENSQNPELYIAQTLLTWVQNFDYKRDNATRNNTDFTSLPAAICGDGNDCDSRSLLICAFMRSLGYEAILLISPEYSHAMAAVELNAPGQKYIPAGTDREFLMGETTAKVTWGMIAQNHADRSKWIPVYLP